MNIRADNSQLVELITSLEKAKKPFWKKVAYELARPRRQRAAVNISKLDIYASDSTTLLVPGKVLGSGDVSKKYTVAAFAFSESAKELISKAGGKIISISELYKTNPEGKNVVIIK